MKEVSLRVRSVMLAVVMLGLFIPTTTVILDKAYTSSLIQAKLNELKLMNLALVSAFELDGAIPYMPELLYEEQLNIPDSGYMGLIVFRDNIVWQSASALHHPMSSPPPAPDVGEERFLSQYPAPFDEQKEYFAYAFTAEFASQADFEPVHFYIFNDKSEFSAEHKAFLGTVWQGMLILAAGMLALLFVGMNRVLAPVRALISDIKQTARGEQNTLEGNYPVEFDGLKNSINQLLQFEAQQRSRYKNRLGDLAHSLKTPLAVAMNTENLPVQAKDAMQHINQLIQRQLKRASAGQSGWQTAVTIGPIAHKVCAALNKVYQDKRLQIELTDDANARFLGDETDLMELLGNLLDNACKAARKRVHLTLQNHARWCEIRIEDDGPGIPEEKRTNLLKRGERLDTYTEGQGIGLAVVSDLVDIYQGRLKIERSATLEGASITLEFPYPD
ncbi:GHKL domain-containing protein [Alteromonas aestuariivivens]|uniref:histidine kinase n=1 Tax=Alteromonas aestuariivivens TaxID=1938339 RepID=A0A3D8M3G2_9ALTE|nr:ATP-binding protein [Alteromonas aestuariivivens]RDV24277.1 GHKL domain-containing protein [Alteromonas aestuariivivens]